MSVNTDALRRSAASPITAVNYLSTVPNALRGVDAPGAVAGAYAVAAAFGIGAILLWVFPMWTAHALLPRTSHTDKLGFDPYELARVGCGLLGLWLFAKAVPSFVWFLFRAFLVAGSSSAFGVLTPDAKLDLAFALAELVIGGLLLFRAGLFARLIVPVAKDVERRKDVDASEGAL